MDIFNVTGMRKGEIYFHVMNSGSVSSLSVDARSKVVPVQVTSFRAQGILSLVIQTEEMIDFRYFGQRPHISNEPLI
jgi:hypothetical protein